MGYFGSFYSVGSVILGVLLIAVGGTLVSAAKNDSNDEKAGSMKTKGFSSLIIGIFWLIFTILNLIDYYKY